MPELKLENSIVDDRYLIDSCLGRGSYAEIFIAADDGCGGQQVIIKALNMTLQGSLDTELERTLVENFQNEAIALDRVRHPHIIRRLGHGTAADLRATPFHYLVLEYMPGGDLLGLCRRRPLTLEETFYYFQQVAEALAYAHSQGVIHRDIKPNNLLLSADKQTMKIADFGVAKVALDEAAEITRVGTNVYAPPEHHPDSPTDSLNEKLTPSADVYSFAKTIYTAIAGRPPRQFARQPITEFPHDIANEPWSYDLLAILNKASASRVCERYESVQECWEALAQLDSKLRRADADPEATIVRSRLSGTSGSEGAAQRPDFHTLAYSRVPVSSLQKARIVVELPVREANRDTNDGAGTAQADHSTSRSSADSQTPLADDPAIVESGQSASANTAATNGNNTAAQTVNLRPELAARRERNGPTIQTHQLASETARRSGGLRAIVRSEWLRRVFVVLLLATLIGIVAQVYLFFAGGMHSGRRAVISGPSNVNLRSTPRGDVIAVLPEGTNIVVDDVREGWAHIKVISAFPSLSDTPEGWIDNRYVREDR